MMRPTAFGYSVGTYAVTQIGDLNTQGTVSIGYDPSSNTNGSFSGTGIEMLFTPDIHFYQPNSSDDGWVKQLRMQNTVGVTINDGGADLDFRVESDGQTHMLFVDAQNNNIGIGTSSPDADVHLKQLGDIGNGNTQGLMFETGVGSQKYILQCGRSGVSNAYFNLRDVTNTRDIFSVIDTDGKFQGHTPFEWNNAAVFNEGAQNYDFRVESDDNANMFFIDAGGNFVGINNTSSDNLSVLSTTNKTSGNAISITSNTPITGSGEYAHYVEGAMSVDTVSAGNVLSIPIQSQSSKWERYTVEMMFANGEYNSSGNTKGGTCKFMFAALNSIGNGGTVTNLENTGNVSGVSSSGLNIQVSFTSAFTGGQSNYEGVHVYYKVISSRARFMQFWNMTLN
jgi:hypothetical protein